MVLPKILSTLVLSKSLCLELSSENASFSILPHKQNKNWLRKKKKRKSEKRYPISPSRDQHLSPFSEPVIVQFGTTRNDILSYNRILITDTKVLQIYPNLLKFQMRRNHIQKSITVHVLFLQLKQKHCESRD